MEWQISKSIKIASPNHSARILMNYTLLGTRKFKIFWYFYLFMEVMSVFGFNTFLISFDCPLSFVFKSFFHFKYSKSDPKKCNFSAKILKKKKWIPMFEEVVKLKKLEGEWEGGFHTLRYVGIEYSSGYCLILILNWYFRFIWSIIKITITYSTC